MKRKIIAVLMALLCLMPAQVVNIYAEDATNDISVRYNGKEIEFDVKPQEINDRTMVPMRKIFETLGANVTWVPDENGIIATKGSKIVVMVVGSKLMVVTDIADGTENKIELDVAPVTVDDRTLVPVRAISEGLGLEVQWFGESRLVSLSDKVN